MNASPLLYPAPRHLELGGQKLDLSAGGIIQLPARPTDSTLRTARHAQALLDPLGQGTWPLAAGTPDRNALTMRLSVGDEVTGHPDGYRLDVDATGVALMADDEAGLFYAVATLGQLLAAGPSVNHLHIEDYPAIRRRGVMLDVSRDRVQTPATLRLLVDELASWKYNELQLYMEHTFAYAGHETVWGDASPLTAEEILELDIYCRDRFVELVPNQNCLGHLHKWLEHPAYAHLAENYPYRPVHVDEHVMHRGQPFWGDVPYSICPTDPEAVEFVLGLLDELLPNFASRTVNIGLDEPFDLAFGRSRAADPDVDPQRLYVEFMKTVHRHLYRRGYTVQMWGDFVAEHPESVPDLPDDVVVVDWGYWSSYPFDERAALHAAAGRRFYLATGTNAWCSIGGSSAETYVHMRTATDAALRHGADGILVTDWGWFQHGTYQQHVVSYFGFFLAAGELWSPVQSRQVDFGRALSALVLGDASGMLGQVLIRLGEVCQGDGPAIVDSSPLYWALREDLDWIASTSALTEADLDKATQALEGARQDLRAASSTRVDGAQILRELLLTVELLQHAVDRTRLAVSQDDNDRSVLRAHLHAGLPGMVGRFDQSWLTRYRPGGLVGTSARLRAMDADYRKAR